MSLIDLKSDLKNLKVDKDRPFGGSSGLPYIKGGLPEDSPAGEYIADLARYSSDGTVRGGLFSVVSSTTDTIRISRFLNNFPKGLLFTSKQIGLQKSNPKIETGTRGDVLNTQVYNLNSNLLAQIALQGTGEHVPRPGFNTNDLLRDENKYEKIVGNKGTNENRLVTLYNNKILSTPPTNLPSNLEQLGISNLSTELFNYDGGPGSSYGDGGTIIPRVVNTTTSYNNYIAKTSFLQSVPEEGVFALSKFWNKTYKTLSEVSTTEGNTNYQELVGTIRNNSKEINDLDGNIVYLGNTMGYDKILTQPKNLNNQIQDFRKNTIEPNPLAEDYNNININIATRLGIGNPGSRTREQLANPYIANPAGQDRINMSPIFRRNTSVPVEDDYVNTPGEVRDIIKFVIESIDNGYPDQTNRMHFRAFLTSFSDNIGAEWNSQKYMGRGENFYTYQGFTREVGFTFKIAAQAVEEMEKLYQKLNYLASTLHPDYSTGGFMRGTIHRLTIGEYFYRMPGIIKSMNITVEDNYPWEIKMKQPEMRRQNNDQGVSKDQLQMEVPQILNVQMSFVPIYDKLPQKGLKEPIIISDKVANNYLSRPNFDFQT